MSRSAEGFDDLSDHVAGNLVAELKRLRQRELDLLEERRMLRAEVAKAKGEAETWAECVAELRSWRDNVTVAYGSGYGGARFDAVAKGVADLRADRERLEWLEGLTRGVKIELAGTDHGQYVVIETDINRPRSVSRTTLRAAIDEAREKP